MALKTGYGGVVVSSRQLLKDIQSVGGKVLYLEAFSSANYLFRFFSLFYAVFKMKNGEVAFFNFNDRELYSMAPFFILLANMKRLKIIFRPFGGNLDIIYQKNFIFRFLVRFSIEKSNVCLFQTRYLHKFFSFLGTSNHLFWPTRRSVSSVCHLPRRNKHQLRLVYAGKLDYAKGIGNLIEAVERLPFCELDIFGTGDWKEGCALSNRVRFLGSVDSDALRIRLVQYDVLCLPSRYQGEGYPGIILEAFSVGLPILASDWRGLPEIVNHCSNGLIFSELSGGMSLDDCLRKMWAMDLSEMARNSLAGFLNFSVDDPDYKRVLGELVSGDL